MEGVEVIANNDGDVLPVQQQAAAKLVAMRAAKFGYDPRTSVFGHGEVNPGHKQADEGMSTVTRIRNGSLPMQVAAPGEAATPPVGAPATAAGPIEVRGDSLGVGLKGRLNAGGTAVGGASPTAIFDDIKKEPESHWQGQTVVLPSGSNGNQMPVVEDTIKYLQGHGANVVAVGYGPKFPEKNAQLQEIAGRLKVPVIAAEGVDATEGVHPSPRGYQSMAGKIQAAAASFAGPAPTGTAAAPPAGQLEPGNIDLNARPVVKNPDGSISTVASISINEDGKEILIPTVAADGSRILTNDEAIKQYHDTGQHLGKFDTVDNANAAAEPLHLAQAQQYAPGAPGSGGSTAPAAAPPPARELMPPGRAPCRRIRTSPRWSSASRTAPTAARSARRTPTRSSPDCASATIICRRPRRRIAARSSSRYKTARPCSPTVASSSTTLTKSGIISRLIRPRSTSRRSRT